MTDGKTKVQRDEVLARGYTASAEQRWETTCVCLTRDFLSPFIHLSA